MLSLLAFKKSVFAGVLDSGKDEVFLGETRLKQFMDSVDKVTGSIPQPVPEPVEPEPAAETAAAEAAAETAESVLALASPQEQAWTDLATAGMSFLDKLGAALASPPAAGATGGEPSFIARDPQTGEPYLRLPLPAADVVQKLLEGLQALVKR